MPVLSSLNGRLPDALLARVRTTAGECWEWTGAHSAAGYGQIRLGGSVQYLHRLVYELLRGPIPPGLQIDHLCRNRTCCNPDHLEAVTPAENVRRGLSGAHHAAKTLCPQGHPYSGDNLRIDPYGRRKCRRCHSEHARRSAARRKAAAS